MRMVITVTTVVPRELIQLSKLGSLLLKPVLSLSRIQLQNLQCILLKRFCADILNTGFAKKLFKIDSVLLC